MSAEQDEIIHTALPEWTEYRKKNGLDPLGMQNSSVSLYQTFLPGISNVTLRIRYYGLYAWLAMRYAKSIGDTNPESWKRRVRRAEALYALIASHHRGEPGVAGIEWASKELLADRSGDTIDFAAAAEPGSETYYLKQAWGAFGAAYRSQLFEIGIFQRTDDHEIPLPSKPLGERLAQAFEKSLGELADQYFAVVERGTVQPSELQQLGPFLPSAIVPQSDEWLLYEDILITRINAPGSRALSRKLSIQLILRIANLLGREPRADEIRWVLYAGYDKDGNALSLGDPALEAQRARWWVYHANDLCHIAYEALLKFALDTLSEYPAGLSLARLIGLCADTILDQFDIEPQSWDELIASSIPASNAFDIHILDSEAALSSKIIRAGRSDASVCLPKTAVAAVRMIAILHRRIEDTKADINEPLGVLNPDAFRSLLTETHFLDSHRKEPFRRILERILEERVIRRHLWVAMRKLRHQSDYTFLIETDDGKLRLRGKDGPVFTNPRLGPAISFLKDIALLDQDGLTDLGKKAMWT